MTPIRLFDPFLTPPSVIASLPKLGQLSLVDCVILVIGTLGGMALGSAVAGGLGGLLGLAGGLIGSFRLMRGEVLGQPLAHVVLGCILFWWTQRRNPAALTLDLAALHGAADAGRGPVLIQDAAGTSQSVIWREGSR